MQNSVSNIETRRTNFYTKIRLESRVFLRRLAATLPREIVTVCKPRQASQNRRGVSLFWTQSADDDPTYGLFNSYKEAQSAYQKAMADIARRTGYTVDVGC